jgi:glycerate kinase
MRIVVAPQEFKGTLTAEEAAAAMAQGARAALPDADVEVIPLADGGPGTVRALAAAAGGELRTATVRGPMGAAIDAEWGVIPGGHAVIEMASAGGLVLVPKDARDPRLATTYGVGELIIAALDAGCRHLIVGLGGSATNDGGAGMAQALGVRFLDAAGEELPPGGAALARLDRIDTSGIDGRVRECRVIGATDVRNPLCGPEGASVVYGPQKGATQAVVEELDGALRRYAEVVERDLGVPVVDVPGAGSAGGLGAALIAFLGAEIRPGIEVVAEAARLRERLGGASLVITGEGRLDGQTQYGKTVAGVARIARDEGVGVLVVAGALGDGWDSMIPLVSRIETVVGTHGEPAERLSAAVERAVSAFFA